jgi:hypothetical protein
MSGDVICLVGSAWLIIYKELELFDFSLISRRITCPMQVIKLVVWSDLGWNDVESYSHVLRLLHLTVDINILELDYHERCLCSGDDAVEQHHDCRVIGCFGGGIVWVLACFALFGDNP